MCTTGTTEVPEWRRPLTQMYSLDVYQAADAEIDSKDVARQMDSFLATNVVEEVLHRMLYQPLAQIPNLVDRLKKKGPVDADIIAKVDAVLQNFPTFWQSLSTKQLGLAVQGRYADLVNRANKLLFAHDGQYFPFNSVPLINVLAMYLMKTRNLKKDQTSVFLAQSVQGSLVDDVGKIAENLRGDVESKACQHAQEDIAAAKEKIRVTREERKVAEERIAKANERIAKADERIAKADEQSRILDGKLAEINHKIELLGRAEEVMDSLGMLRKSTRVK